MLCLQVKTDAAWANEAIRDLDSVLIDHAHCELKAASSATSLVARFAFIPEIARALSEIAREELEHFERVLAFLQHRKIALAPPEIDLYAKELRSSIASLPSPGQTPLVDRLLVGALIEARSCERFKLLLTALEESGSEDRELAEFYRDLFECEARHYRVYVDLAVLVATDRAFVEGRLELLAQREGQIVARLATEKARATVHG